jgi:hypothetical protein
MLGRELETKVSRKNQSSAAAHPLKASRQRSREESEVVEKK